MVAVKPGVTSAPNAASDSIRANRSPAHPATTYHVQHGHPIEARPSPGYTGPREASSQGAGVVVRTVPPLPPLRGTSKEDALGTEHRGARADLVVELTNCGLDTYFIQPLKQSGPGFMVQQSANLGMASVKQVMGSVIRQIIGRMDGAQLHSVCGSIRHFTL